MQIVVATKDFLVTTIIDTFDPGIKIEILIVALTSKPLTEVIKFFRTMILDFKIFFVKTQDY